MRGEYNNNMHLFYDYSSLIFTTCSTSALLLLLLDPFCCCCTVICSKAKAPKEIAHHYHLRFSSCLIDLSSRKSKNMPKFNLFSKETDHLTRYFANTPRKPGIFCNILKSLSNFSIQKVKWIKISTFLTNFISFVKIYQNLNFWHVTKAFLCLTVSFG